MKPRCCICRRELSGTISPVPFARWTGHEFTDETRPAHMDCAIGRHEAMKAYQTKRTRDKGKP